MAVRRVARDEHAPYLVALGDGNAQVPEPDVVELAVEPESGRFLHQSVKIEAVFLSRLTGAGA